MAIRTGSLWWIHNIAGSGPACRSAIPRLAAAKQRLRRMNVLLFEVSPTDPVTFGAVALCVILATKVDPLIALRYE